MTYRAFETSVDPIEAQVEEGLRLFGQGREPEAIACWLAVLHQRPGHTLALDYLGCAGVHPLPTGEPLNETPVVDFAQRRDEQRHRQAETEARSLVARVEDLLHRDRIAEALAVLKLARSKNLQDPQIERAVARLEGRLEKHGVGPSPPAAAPIVPAADFDALFAAALASSLRGDRAAALEQFRACALLRPDDPRVRANLNRLAGLTAQGSGLAGEKDSVK